MEANLVTKKEHETLTEFQAKIDHALIQGDEWVETTPEIIKYYNRNGLGKHSEYFIYKNIKVCLNGQGDRIREQLETQIGNLVYGKDEARVNMPDKTTPIVPVT